jgi:hypothetical protein
MKNRIGLVTVIGLLATTLSATVAAAQCSTPPDPPGLMIKFDRDAWAYETAYTPANFKSALGSQLTVVGIVSWFCNPFSDLNPADPNTEYTFIWDGLVSEETITQTIGSFGAMKYTTRYLGGGFRIYAGSPRNAPTVTPPDLPSGVVPDAFVDGTMILGGVMDTVLVIVNRSSGGIYTSSFKAHYQATGGTRYCQVGSARTLMDGLWCPVPPTSPSPTGTCPLPTGWSAHPNGKWDTPNPLPPPTGACCLRANPGACVITTPADCVVQDGVFLGLCTVCDFGICLEVPANKTSWGQLKTIYR